MIEEKLIKPQKREDPYTAIKKKLLEAAADEGVTVNLTRLEDEAHLYPGDEDEDEELEDEVETKEHAYQTIYEDIRIAETAMRFRPDLEEMTCGAAAVSASSGVELLRGIHKIKDLTKLEEVEEALWERNRALKAAEKSPGGRGFG
jgi:hypothetical protein